MAEAELTEAGAPVAGAGESRGGVDCGGGVDPPSAGAGFGLRLSGCRAQTAAAPHRTAPHRTALLLSAWFSSAP